MKEMDRITIEKYGMPVLLLMENAGRAVANVARQMSQKKFPILVVAGSGNNGGDGIVAARYLYNMGSPVEILLAKSPDNYQGDTAVHMNLAENFGVPMTHIKNFSEKALIDKMKNSHIIIDALLGTGTTGKLREPYKTLIQRINQSKGTVLAVDIPSGLNGDTGEVENEAIYAKTTVTMAYAKKGLLTKQAQPYVGKLIIADIGFPKKLTPK